MPATYCRIMAFDIVSCSIIETAADYEVINFHYPFTIKANATYSSHSSTSSLVALAPLCYTQTGPRDIQAVMDTRQAHKILCKLAPTLRRAEKHDSGEA